MDQSESEFDTSENHRKATRFIRKDIKVSFVKTNFMGQKESINCELLDISSTGMQISTPKKIALNSSLEIELKFKSGDDFKLKSKAVWNKQNTIFQSKHVFLSIKRLLENKDLSLQALNLFEKNTYIFAKFRDLSTNSVQILTYSPLNQNKQHNLVFTLNDKSTHKFYTKIKSYHHSNHNCYGLTFNRSNDALGDCLLDTQTELIFK